MKLYTAEPQSFRDNEVWTQGNKPEVAIVEVLRKLYAL